MKKNFFLLILAIFSLVGFAQKIDVEFRKITIEEGIFNPLSSIELLPDNKTAVIGSQKDRIYLWDIKSETIIKQISISGYPNGPKIKVSKDGKFLLLQKQHYADFNLNKDRTTKIELLNIETEETVFSQVAVHDANLSSDNKQILTLTGNSIDIYNVETGKKEKTIEIENATNAFAISSDNKTIAVSHKLNDYYIKNIPSIRNDKKAIKEALKFREGVSFYEFETGKLLKSANDVFDVVYNIKYTDDGKKILVYNVANTKLQQQAGGGMGARQGYINQVNSTTGEVLRTIVSSMTPEPDFKINTNNNWFGVSSSEMQGKLIQTLLIYDLNSGSLLNKFEVNTRLFAENGAPLAVYFIFYPNENKVLLTYAGGQVAVWNVK